MVIGMLQESVTDRAVHVARKVGTWCCGLRCSGKFVIRERIAEGLVPEAESFPSRLRGTSGSCRLTF